MSDEDFLELFSDFLMGLRVHDASDTRRDRIFHEVESALGSILNRNGIEASLGKQPNPTSVSEIIIGDTQRHILERIGRAIFSEHPNHLKMKDIFKFLDMDKDGMVSADDLHKGLQVHMKTELPLSQIESVILLFHKDPAGKLLYFQFVHLLQVAMQNAIDDEDKIINTARASLLPDQRKLLDQIGCCIESSPHAGHIKELFFRLSKTYAHLVTSNELLEFCSRSGIKFASNELVDRVVEHFNPRGSSSDVHALSYAQFARLCSESANRNFKNNSESENSTTCLPAEENLDNFSTND